MRKVLIACLICIFALQACGQVSILQEGLALKYLVQLPAERSQHTPVIILLHGYGADERDLFELRAHFPENYLIIAARGPYALPGAGFQWFEGSMVNGKYEGNIKQIENSRDKIEQFITQVTTKYNADSKQVYLIGFSQGAMMSYEVGLTDPDKVKGIGVLSGRIFPSLKPSVKNIAALKKLKIFISHGTADNRIPIAEAIASNDYLKSIGLKPDFHQYPGMGHTISPDVIKDLLKWLE